MLVSCVYQREALRFGSTGTVTPGQGIESAQLGAGIFVLPAIAAVRAGQATAFSYLIAGLICLPVAMIISELATGMPRAGGSYTFITQALGPVAGSIVGPANWLGLTFANGFLWLLPITFLPVLDHPAVFLCMRPFASICGTIALSHRSGGCR